MDVVYAVVAIRDGGLLGLTAAVCHSCILRKEDTVRALIIVIIVGIAGYYAYKETFSGGDEAPTCKQAFQSCSTKCRQTTTESGPYTACLKKCQSDLEACVQ